MQLNLGIQDSTPPTRNRAVQYSHVALCNKCGATHDMTVSVLLSDGPIEKQSIGHLYSGKTLPKSLADLTNRGVSCPKTGRQSIQKDKHQIFLVPAKLITYSRITASIWSLEIYSSNTEQILVDNSEHYDRILSEFDEESPVYAILKNGLVFYNQKTAYDIRTVEILCDKFHARIILAAAEMYCPEAIAEIEERSDFPGRCASSQ